MVYFLILLTLGILIFHWLVKANQPLKIYNVDFGYDYFPLEIGKYQTYVVDSIVYDIG